MSNRLRMRSGGVIGIVLLASVAALLARGDDEPDSWVVVQAATLVESVEVEGRLEAEATLDYGPPAVTRTWNFKIAFMAPEGEPVAVGDPILIFDSSELTQRLAELRINRDSVLKTIEKRTLDVDVEKREARLGLEEAQAKLEKADLKVDVPSGVIAKAEIEKARLDLELARSEVEYRRARFVALGESLDAELALLAQDRDRVVRDVEALEREIELMTVRTTAAGTVIYKLRNRGEKRKVGDQVWRAEKVVEIPDLSSLTVAAEVEEADAGRLEVGQVVELRLDAQPDRLLRGRIAAVRRSVERRSRRDPQPVLQLRIGLEELDPERLRPGMRVHGTVRLAEGGRLPVVPSSAVRRDGDELFVRVRGWFGARRVVVETGRREGDRVEIVEGLEVGDVVRTGL